MSNTRGGDPEGDFSGTFPQFTEVPKRKSRPKKRVGRTALRAAAIEEEQSLVPTTATMRYTPREQLQHSAAMLRQIREGNFSDASSEITTEEPPREDTTQS